ncbi:MAG: hypothetical protein R3Y35_05105 [Clostridia bacterium]
MYKVMVSSEFPQIINSLQNKGYVCIKIQANPFLPYPVRFHSDLQFLKIDSNKAFVLKNNCLDLEEYNLLKTYENPGDKYPNDCLLNCLILGKKVFGNKNAIDKNLLHYFQKNNFDFIHVNQGYAKCSTCIIDKSHCITADPCIYNALTENNINVLKINEGYIDLKGYDYGFIGGSSGKIGDKIIFTGSLKTHPQGEIIKNYIENLNYQIIELTNNRLIDIGTIIEL